jgi:hypothetical protein
MTDDEELEEHTLAIGGTRPALMPYLGVPWPDFIVFFIAGVEAAMSRVELLVPIGLALLFSLRLYRRDYNAGRCFVCWLTTSGRHLASDVFGGTFISPAPGRCFRGIYHG